MFFSDYNLWTGIGYVSREVVEIGKLFNDRKSKAIQKLIWSTQGLLPFLVSENIIVYPEGKQMRTII